MREEIEKLGWGYVPMHGWIHPDVRDDDGKLRYFDSVEDVCRYINIEEEVT